MGKDSYETALRSMRGAPEDGRSFFEYQEDMRLPPLKFFRNKRILDLGAGPTLRFARDLEDEDIGAEVYSLSPAFAEKKWKQKAITFRPHDLSSQRMVAAMAEQMPFADNFFDVVVSHSALSWTKTTAQFLKELRETIRVTAPFGDIFIFSISADPRNTEGAIRVPPSTLEKLLGNTATVSYVPSPISDRPPSINTLYVLRLKKKGPDPRASNTLN